MNNEIAPGVYRPRRTVDIGTGEQVTHPNGSGWVSRPSWEPSEGKRRQEQIEEARVAAIADYQASLAEQHPHAVRISALEAQVKSMAEKLEHLNKQFVEVITDATQR